MTLTVLAEKQIGADERPAPFAVVRFSIPASLLQLEYQRAGAKNAEYAKNIPEIRGSPPTDWKQAACA